MNKNKFLIILIVIAISISVIWNYRELFQYSVHGFSVVLTDEGSMLLSDMDIESYNATSHELTLTDKCANRLKMGESLIGDFKIIIEGKEDITGIFVPPFVSRSYPSTIVVIVYPPFDSDYKTMKIQMGYPWDQPTGIDPKQTSKMVQYFNETSKLIQ